MKEETKEGRKTPQLGTDTFTYLDPFVPYFRGTGVDTREKKLLDEETRLSQWYRENFLIG